MAADSLVVSPSKAVTNTRQPRPQSARIFCYKSMGGRMHNLFENQTIDSQNDIFNRRVVELGAENPQVALEIRTRNQSATAGASSVTRTTTAVTSA